MQNEVSSKKTTYILALLSAVFVIATMFFGDFVVPFASAFFACLLLVDNKKHLFSYAVFALGILCTVFVFSPVTIWCAASLALGGIIHLMRKFHYSKCDVSIFLTVITSLFIVGSFAVYACQLCGVYSFDTVVNFYNETVEAFKTWFVTYATEMYSTIGEVSIELDVTEEVVKSAVDAFIDSLPSLIAILAFVISGVSLKVYTFLLRKCSIIKTKSEWGFFVPSVYAYFYVIAYLISIFVYTGVVGITLSNVISLLSFVFAYVGLCFVHRELKKRGRNVLAVLLPVFAIFAAGVLAFEILSVFGVVHTFYKNKQNKNSNFNSDNNSSNL